MPPFFFLQNFSSKTFTAKMAGKLLECEIIFNFFFFFTKNLFIFSVIWGALQKKL